CLAMILSYYGRKTGIAEVRERCGVGRDGLSALAIVRAARQYGLRVRAVSLPRNDLRFVPLPAIVHWEFNHFVVLERWSAQRVEVLDPALGRRRLSAEEFDEGFTGVVIELEPGVHFTRQNSFARLSLWTYLRSVFHLPGFLAQLALASLLLQLLGLGVPVLTKVFVDQIIPGTMHDIMPLIGIGILIIALAQLVAALLRS